MTILALDGGGTGTQACLADANEVRWEAQFGPTNFAVLGRTEWQQQLQQALQEAPRVDAAYGCFAGVLTPDDEATAASLLAEILGLPTERCRVESDCAAALASFPSEVNIGLIAGTGSSVFSRVEGRLRRSGGGGPLFGDPGSGADIGRRWLAQEVLMAGGNPGSCPGAEAHLIRKCGQLSRDHTIRWVYDSASPGAELAELFPYIAKEAPDHPCIGASFKVLAEQVVAHHQTFHAQTSLHLGLAGGVWNAHGMPELFGSILSQGSAIPATILRPDCTPVRGALRAAQQLFA